MGGPAIVDLLFGEAVPSGRLPVTIPRHVGQIPLYYSQKHGGKPVSPSSYVHMNDIPKRASQTSLGMVSAHLDVYFTPRYPFGFGLNYSKIEYSDIALNKQVIREHEALQVSVSLKNTGTFDAVETVQLFIRDRVGSVTRPIKELKAFQKVALSPYSSVDLKFDINVSELKFYDIDMEYKVEAGEFDIWVGSDSNAELHSRFKVAT
jgi:beta-glucosidase